MKKLLLAVTVLGMALASMAQAAVKSVVLVHGAFADGSGWKPVAGILEHDGYTVYIVQEAETSFEAATRIVLERPGPCVLVGHSRGGMIFTEAGTHASVRSLVHINAFQPDVGESTGALQGKTPTAAKSIGTVSAEFVAVNPQAFHQDFAADLPKSTADFMSISQVPIAAASFDAKVRATTWSQKRSYAVVSAQDRMINPELERSISTRAKSETIELTGSHEMFLSDPKEAALMRTLDPSAALSFSPESHVTAPPRANFAVGRYDVLKAPRGEGSEFHQRELTALNLLGIRYAKGEGVKKNAGKAMRFFLRSAMQGYTPAIANVGSLYETGAMGHPNFHSAYAWVRTALSFGVPEEDHDATVLKLGMIAARLSPVNIGGAERLAAAIASRIIYTCECTPGQETELASNGSR